MEGSAPPELTITPPLLNSANPWATTLKDLQELYHCPHTGAVTTRTSLIDGFPHDDAKHQYTFFSPSTSLPVSRGETAKGQSVASLNNLGYSPLPLSKYISFIKTIHDEIPEDSPESLKPIIVSVTGSPDDILRCYEALARAQLQVPNIPLAMEINLSCPNIPSAPPPAYSSVGLASYLSILPASPAIPIGLKTPPYTISTQFDALLDALRTSSAHTTRTALTRTFCRVSFLTATNTLGNCLVLDPESDGSSASLPGDTGLGGMAGAPLHPLALGNVKSLAAMLARYPELHHIRVIGVGGVGDAAGYKRMRAVGAYAVGVGTALGNQGVAVFGAIAEGFGEES